MGIRTLAQLSENPNPDTQDAVQNLVQSLIRETETEESPEELLMQLNAAAAAPFDINAANVRNLENLVFLTDWQIEALLDYLDRSKPMLSYYEIPYIKGFSQLDAERLALFTYITGLQKKKRVTYKPNLWIGRVQTVLPLSEAYTKEKYSGYPWKLYSKLRIEEQKFSVGITAENDAGERFLELENAKGFDFYSFYLEYHPGGNYKVVVGDYAIQWGQGLACWGGFSLSKTDIVTSIKKVPQGLKRYGSSDENAFFRGVAYQYQNRKHLISAFISYHPIDASATETDLGEIETNSEQSSGLHRTESEIAGEDRLILATTGVHYGFTAKNLKLGVSALAYRYNNNFSTNRTLSDLWHYGQQGGNLAVDYYKHLSNVSLYGEIATNHLGAAAMLHGADFNTGKYLDFSVQYRDYSPQYTAPFASAFSESSSSLRNEKGLYIGAILHPLPFWSVACYADAFRFPWLRYYTDMPSFGHEYMCRVTYEGNKNWSANARIKYETKTNNISGNISGLKSQIDAHKYSARLELKSQIQQNLNSRTRIECSFFSDSIKLVGWMAYQELIWKSESTNLKCIARFCVFQTVFDTRIYTYENDLLYGFSVPALIGNGIRTNLLAEYKISKYYRIGIRWAYTFQPDRSELGSGYDIIPGSRKHELKLQLIAKW
jgi:hypothetical protein